MYITLGGVPRVGVFYPGRVFAISENIPGYGSDLCSEDRFKNDKEVVLAAVASAGQALKYVGKAAANH